MKLLPSCAFAAALLLPRPAAAQSPTAQPDTATTRQQYQKLDRRIRMRDGVQLYTVVYVPRGAAPATPYPIIMVRTPYSAGPYGENHYRPQAGPSAELTAEKYIFVYQDVRGRYLSEGQFEEMTPALTPAQASPTAHDESTDTFDTIEWLLKNVPGNNGRVGMVGISYPGFYATAALPNAHPALKAVSPQAPVTDEFIGDDARHKGAFFLLDNFEFTNYFDIPRPKPVVDYAPLFKFETKDVYQFFLRLGPIKNANLPQYFNHRARIWNEYQQHETYDAYWQARNSRPALTGLGSAGPAVLVVGGWFDAEDLFGALNTYKALEKQNPGMRNHLVMGPWTHGAWARPDWSKFGSLRFGSNTAETFRQTLETPFFNFYLKDKGTFNPAEATVFNTGTNEWKTYPAWPPADVEMRALYFHEAGRLFLTASEKEPQIPLSGMVKSLDITPNKVKHQAPFTQYLSDPANPVPYTAGVHGSRVNEYMIEDQRFLAKRPDVLTFRTQALPADFTLAGPLEADLWVSTSGTDADFIVKVIDELPDGTQRLVRAEVMRGRFRNSFSKPEAFKPNQPAEVKYELPDVLHTFAQGHRLLVQVQSTWFPLVDRNPQTFVPLATADAKDFQKATIRIYHDAAHPSAVRLTVLR
ncbi:MAG: CocE/NonD family hydrolase [Bacteroidota bacterium]|nr:CocE/NonD family hydrolase [Bacteroidota bacterium]